MPRRKAGSGHPALRRTVGETVMDSRSAQIEAGKGEPESILSGIDPKALDAIFSATYEELQIGRAHV